MKYTEKLQSLLDKHEALKAKWLALNEQDLMDWIVLCDNMIDLYIEKKSEYQEERQKLKVEIGKKKIELKEAKNKDGKKKHTESTADAVIDELYYEKNIEQDTRKLEIDLLQEKKNIIMEYINLGKKVVFKD